MPTIKYQTEITVNQNTLPDYIDTLFPKLSRGELGALSFEIINYFNENRKGVLSNKDIEPDKLIKADINELWKNTTIENDIYKLFANKIEWVYASKEILRVIEIVFGSSASKEYEKLFYKLQDDEVKDRQINKELGEFLFDSLLGTGNANYLLMFM